MELTYDQEQLRYGGGYPRIGERIDEICRLDKELATALLARQRLAGIVRALQVVGECAKVCPWCGTEWLVEPHKLDCTFDAKVKAFEERHPEAG